uniref:Uncharacterized protein n=1 Tax=Rhizophora mucronata TaxID=61149 RepID=A0A2P2PNH3_RHIMU
MTKLTRVTEIKSKFSCSMRESLSALY